MPFEICCHSQKPIYNTEIKNQKQHNKQGMASYTYNPRTVEAKAGGTRVQGQPGLQISKLDGSLGTNSLKLRYWGCRNF